jgi:hypothetical protein
MTPVVLWNRVVQVGSMMRLAEVVVSPWLPTAARRREARSKTTENPVTASLAGGHPRGHRLVRGRPSPRRMPDYWPLRSGRWEGADR